MGICASGWGALLLASLPAVLCGSVFLQCARTLVIRKAADIIYLKSPLQGPFQCWGIKLDGPWREVFVCCFCFVGRLFITGNNFGFLKERIMFSCLMELTKMVLWEMWLSCVQRDPKIRCLKSVRKCSVYKKTSFNWFEETFRLVFITTVGFVNIPD